jgi:hypothetical protein
MIRIRPMVRPSNVFAAGRPVGSTPDDDVRPSPVRGFHRE